MIKITITTTEIVKISLGNRAVRVGKSVLSGGSSSGDVITGLKYLDILFPIIKGATQQGISVNETFPLSNIDPTVVVETANSTFYWIAIGRG